MIFSEVVGFLPEASEDLLIVPEEHTVQLGEDYDIDKRYIYKSNYTVNKSVYPDGKTRYEIKKLREKDINKLSKEWINNISWEKQHEIIQNELFNEIDEN